MTFITKWARSTRSSGALRAALVVSALSALACNAENSTAPIERQDPAPADAPVVETEVLDSATPQALTSATAPGIAFGNFHLPTSSFKAPYSGALRILTKSYATSTLNAAKSANMRIVVNLAGGRKYYKNADGTFSFSKWQSRIAAWKGFPFGSYVTAGVVIGHYLVDEPSCYRCYGGKRITAAQLEAMAKYSKSLWPSLPTGVRAAPTQLDNVVFQYLNFAWAQWEGPNHGVSHKLSPGQFRDVMTSAAKSRHLGLVFGLNYLNGGDGSSGRTGTQTGYYRMSPSEVKNVGGVLAAAPYACALLDWLHDLTYLNQSGMPTAISYVSGVAKNRSRTSCVK
jgi:hypothetical protein